MSQLFLIVRIIDFPGFHDNFHRRVSVQVDRPEQRVLQLRMEHIRHDHRYGELVGFIVRNDRRPLGSSLSETGKLILFIVQIRTTTALRVFSV